MCGNDFLEVEEMEWKEKCMVIEIKILFKKSIKVGKGLSDGNL